MPSLLAKLKGWRTIIFARFLVLFGIVLTGLSALDVVQLDALLPPKIQPFAPVILAFIGGMVEALRRVTDTAVGRHDHDDDHHEDGH